MDKSIVKYGIVSPFLTHGVDLTNFMWKVE